MTRADATAPRLSARTAGRQRYDLPEYERIFTAGTLAITVSVLGHALAAVPAVTGYGRATGVADEGEELTLAGRLP